MAALTELRALRPPAECAELLATHAVSRAELGTESITTSSVGYITREIWTVLKSGSCGGELPDCLAESFPRQPSFRIACLKDRFRLNLFIIRVSQVEAELLGILHSSGRVDPSPKSKESVFQKL